MKREPERGVAFLNRFDGVDGKSRCLARQVKYSVDRSAIQTATARGKQALRVPARCPGRARLRGAVMGTNWSEAFRMATVRSNLSEPLLKQFERQVKDGTMEQAQYERLRAVILAKNKTRSRIDIKWDD